MPPPVRTQRDGRTAGRVPRGQAPLMVFSHGHLVFGGGNHAVARQFVRDGDEAFRQRASVITRELYNFACDNGPKDPERRLSFEFTFIDDATCSITLAEPFRLKLERKISKIREIATQPNPILEGLPVDEASLATVIRLSDHFEHRASEKQSAYVARLVQTEPPAASA